MSYRYLPLPSTFVDPLKLSSSTNRSLVFDRGMDRYETKNDPKPRFLIPTGGKEAFLKDFRDEYRTRRPATFEHFLTRRAAAMEKLKAEAVELKTHSRIVIGLGLPHPTETGLLLDRLTGSVYFPGSSVKGLLRAAARLTADGELEGDQDFWEGGTVWRIFGPEIAPGVTPKTGCVRFFDAFPTTWPRLEIDVLTPHFSRYYDGKKDVVPADWESPNPVPFLTVAEGQTLRFYFNSTDEERWQEDKDQLKTLLGLALEWLGIGGKKSSGYGQLKIGDLPARPEPLPLVERKDEKEEPGLDERRAQAPPRIADRLSGKESVRHSPPRRARSGAAQGLEGQAASPGGRRSRVDSWRFPDRNCQGLEVLMKEPIDGNPHGRQ